MVCPIHGADWLSNGGSERRGEERRGEGKRGKGKKPKSHAPHVITKHPKKMAEELLVVQYLTVTRDELA